MKSIIINVSDTGEIKIEAIGFKGNACEKATKAIEQALGAPAGPRTKKPEYFQQNSNQQKAGL